MASQVLRNCSIFGDSVGQNANTNKWLPADEREMEEHTAFIDPTIQSETLSTLFLMLVKNIAQKSEALRPAREEADNKTSCFSMASRNCLGCFSRYTS